MSDLNAEYKGKSSEVLYCLTSSVAAWETISCVRGDAHLLRCVGIKAKAMPGRRTCLGCGAFLDMKLAAVCSFILCF